MAPNAQQPKLQRAPSPPSWFGPHAILEAVERLVVNDNNNAAQGWTSEEIKFSLMQTHTQGQRQQEIQEEGLPLNFFDDDMLRVELDRLLRKGDLKLVGVGGQHYTLCPPYLPPWFRPGRVLEAVDKLDEGNAVAGGSPWEQIRDFLKGEHQPHHPLPPDFDTLLRTMLSVLRQNGHLTWGASGPRHYTRRQAPALVELSPIDIPGYLWCYYLGYKLGAGDGDGLLDDSADSGPDEDSPACLANNPNVLSWFGPGMVLQEIERLTRMEENNNPFFGFTCEELRNSLIGTHKQQNQQDLPQGFDLDTTLRATLATLSKGGYLTMKGVGAGQSYTLSMTPPASFSFPTWFRPEAVLQAVEELDHDNNNDNGSTTGDIWSYFGREHDLVSSYPLCLWFTRLLQSMLSVLRQRGHLRWGASGRWFYTRRDAPATIGLPDDLLGYYAGYKLAGGYDLDDDVKVKIEDPPSDGLRRRRNISNISSARAETEPLLTPSRSSSAAAENGAAATDTDGENPNEEAKRKEKRRHLRYMIWRVFLSLFGHVILFGLSFIPGFGEETSGHHEEKNPMKWFKWVVMDAIVPIAALIVMLLIQFFVDLGIEDDTSQRTPQGKKRVKTNKMVNLGMLTASKLFYVAIKEAPGPKNTLRIIAHVVALVIDMIGAIYLWWKHSGLDQEMSESSWKDE